MAKKKAAAKLPRQKALPGMADSRIVVLERAALKYADIRDERMRWTKQEVEAKKRVQQLMHEQDRKHYARANIEITLEPKTEEEKVIVRVLNREAPVNEPVEQPPAVEEPEPEQKGYEEPEDDPDAQESQDEF